MNNVIKFDPDELKLTKTDILDLMNGIEKRWKNHKRQYQYGQRNHSL